MSVPTLPHIESRQVPTARINTHVLFSGPGDGEPSQQVIADTAHSPHIEAPDTFNTLLHSFLAQAT